MLKQYPSVAALRQDYITHVQGRDKRGYGHYNSDDMDVSWYGGETTAQTLALSLSGDTKLVAEAEALLTKLDLVIETPRKQWERAPAGVFAVVPEVLAGLPTPMRRQVTTYEDVAPISVYVSTSSSAGIGASVLRKRGTVILALVMALSRVRPVSLHALAFMDGYKDHSGETILTAQINTSPLDLATACYTLTSAGFARRMTYDLATALNDFRGGWPKAYGYGNRANTYYDYLKGIMGTDPTKTLIVGAAELHDKLLTKPLEWIQDQITRFTEKQEDYANA